MPPKKKTRPSQASQVTSPPAPTQPKTPTPAAAPSPSKTDAQILADPWTDDEEIALFKGLMQWKPTGIHKHFRLIQLHQHLLSTGAIHPRAQHTRPAGIWAKLRTLYDLAALDAREDARQLGKIHNPLLSGQPTGKNGEDGDGDVDMDDADDASAYSELEEKIEVREFALPGGEEDGWAELLWKKRFPEGKEAGSDGEDGESELPDINLAPDPPIPFMPSFSLEPSERPTPTPSLQTGRGRGRGRGRAGRKAATRKSARQAESVADEEEEKDQESNGEEEEGEESSDEEEVSRTSTPAPRGSGRGRWGGRGRGVRGRGRGRPRGGR